MPVGHANRGRIAEQIIEMSNAYYGAQGIALVIKVPTAWLPLRDGNGHIISAKVEHKAVCDFIGCWFGKSIAFDVKEFSTRTFSLARLAPHQHEFLTTWERCGGLSFLLIHSVVANAWHVLTLAQYDALRLRYKNIQIEMHGILCDTIPGCPVNYVAALKGER